MPSSENCSSNICFKCCTSFSHFNSYNFRALPIWTVRIATSSFSGCLYVSLLQQRAQGAVWNNRLLRLLISVDVVALCSVALEIVFFCFYHWVVIYNHPWDCFGNSVTRLTTDLAQSNRPCYQHFKHMLTTIFFVFPGLCQLCFGIFLKKAKKILKKFLIFVNFSLKIKC